MTETPKKDPFAHLPQPGPRIVSTAVRPAPVLTKPTVPKAVESLPEGVSSPDALRMHLRPSKLVKVKDADGSEWGFMINPVSFWAWDDMKVWPDLMREDPDEFLRIVEKATKSPSDAAFARVFVQGVDSPKISIDGADGTVPVQDFIRKTVLATELYAEIVNLTFDGVLTAEVE